MSERWRRYVAEGIQGSGGRAAAAYHAWRYLAPVFERIRRACPPGGRILELGCGAGLHTSLLSSWGYRTVGIDHDAEIVATAEETARALDADARFRVADATRLPSDLGQFDLVFSLGLIEHFDRAESLDMLRHQATLGRVVLAVVPTRHAWTAAPITDERIYTLKAWRAIVRDAGLRELESFAFGDVPRGLGRVAHATLPPRAYRWAQTRYDLGMNYCLVGTRSGT